MDLVEYAVFCGLVRIVVVSLALVDSSILCYVRCWWGWIWWIWWNLAFEALCVVGGGGFGGFSGFGGFGGY